MRWEVAMRERGSMFSRTDTRGQATVEAAFAIPVLFVLLLMLLQPGIILYDRMVMRHAAAEGCRLMATHAPASGFSSQRCTEMVKRQLSAVPPHDLFHVHAPECSWNVELAGGEDSSRVEVTITNRVKLLPLFDMAGAFVGVADAQGCITLRVAASAPTQPDWAQQGSVGLDPSAWAGARTGGG